MYLKEIILIAVIALVTLFTRAIPFVVFSDDKKVPEAINYLGKVLPYAIIAMLVVYCLKDVEFGIGSQGISEIISILVIIVIHIKRRNTILSIGAGTGIYLILSNFIF